VCIERRLLFLSCCVGAANPSFAADAVRCRRSPGGDGYAHRDAGREVLAPVIVIDRDAIERSAAGDVSELLRFHAGLDLGRNGARDRPRPCSSAARTAITRLVLVRRGADQSGHDRPRGTAEHPASLIERIEIVKGPRSALYGTDAIGGVINVITRRGARGRLVPPRWVTATTTRARRA